jgi:hypothetical protein
MEFFALAALVAAFAVVLALTSGDPLRWIDQEIERMAADFWIPDPPELLQPLTRLDPPCRRMVIRQRSLGVYMRRQGVAPRVDISAAWVHDERAFRFVRATR